VQLDFWRVKPMLSSDRRAVLAAFGTNLLAGPLLAQGRAVAQVGFTGRVFLNKKGGVRVHTYLADAKGAMVTSHIVEGASGLAVVDGQFQPHAAVELKTYVESLEKPVQRLIVSHMHPDHWFGIHHFRKMVAHTLRTRRAYAGPVTAKFLTENAAKVIPERKADSSAPEVAGIVAESAETIGGVELHFRHVLNTEVPEILVVEIPAVGAAIVQDIVYNKVHVVVSLQIDNWIAVLRDLEKRGAAAPLFLAGHGEPANPTDLPGLVGDLEAVKPLLATNVGKPDQAKAITDEIAKALPVYQLPPLLTLGLSRALQS
jgi:glyoxylase-like metal-dependent hydrolase (beta-lactamase superfamily II)